MKNVKTLLIMAVLTISLFLLSSCCTNSQTLTSLEWVKFPDPVVDGTTIVTFDGVDTVSMPLWYWKEIVKYASDIDTNVQILENTK